MTKVGIFAVIGLIALGMSCAGDEKAPGGKGTGKKPPPARTTRPATVSSPSTRPTTAPSPTTTRAAIRSRQEARIDVTRVLLKQVAMALDLYNMDVGHYPTEDEGGLEALLKKPEVEGDTIARNWRGPYLKKMPKDAWGRHIDYEMVEDAEADSPQYKLWSLGPDRQSGTADDIGNWLDE